MKLNHILLFCLAIGLTFMSCRKSESEIQGCMDPASLDYDPRATIDDGSCSYWDLNYVLWQNGEEGVWGPNESTQDMRFLSCKGTVDTTLFNNGTDSTLVLFFERDAVENTASMLLSTINSVDAVEFKNGYLQFEALLPNNSGISTFQVKISGTVQTNSGVCGTRSLSDLINISTDVLNDSTFTTIQLPIVDFQKKDFVDIQDIMSIQATNSDLSANDTLLMVRNIQWFSN